MEPITLCGVVIVAFGFWVELEAPLKALARVIRKCTFFKGGATLVTAGQRPVYANRYVPYPG